jgi:hypothetical protein
MGFTSKLTLGQTKPLGNTAAPARIPGARRSARRQASNPRGKEAAEVAKELRELAGRVVRGWGISPPPRNPTDSPVGLRNR